VGNRKADEVNRSGRTTSGMSRAGSQVKKIGVMRFPWVFLITTQRQYIRRYFRQSTALCTSVLPMSQGSHSQSWSPFCPTLPGRYRGNA